MRLTVGWWGMCLGAPGGKALTMTRNFLSWDRYLIFLIRRGKNVRLWESWENACVDGHKIILVGEGKMGRRTICAIARGKDRSGWWRAR